MRHYQHRARDTHEAELADLVDQYPKAEIGIADQAQLAQFLSRERANCGSSPANMTLLYLTCANRLPTGQNPKQPAPAGRKTIRNPPACRVFSVECLRYLSVHEA